MDNSKELRNLVIRKALLKGHFVLSSGATSNYYVDLRRVSLSSEGVSLIAQLVLSKLESGRAVDMIGGPTIGADPIVGAVTALSRTRKRQLDGFLVRKQSKEHGTRAKVEGPPVAGKTVAVIDDVVTTGSSLLLALEAARDAGAEVARVLAVLDRNEGAAAAVEKHGLRLESLLTLADITEG
jgi:orotate phosphoribosyltransferase